jgi:hypothetical protein
VSLPSAESHGYLERFLVAGERVRGTRLLRPTVSERNLELDLTEVNENRARQQKKLAYVHRLSQFLHLRVLTLTLPPQSHGSAMLELIHANEVCRQQWIMGYFGEANSRPCGRCDVCAAFPVESRSTADRIVMAHALEAVRETTEKITQIYKWGAAATGGRGGQQRGDNSVVGIAGATKEQIIKLLAGSRAKKEGYIESRGDEEDQHVKYPRVLFLTPKGRQWLQERGLRRK